jgi:hypothetical protein
MACEGEGGILARRESQVTTSAMLFCSLHSVSQDREVVSDPRLLKGSWERQKKERLTGCNSCRKEKNGRKRGLFSGGALGGSRWRAGQFKF